MLVEIKVGRSVGESMLSGTVGRSVHRHTTGSRGMAGSFSIFP